ncbi:MAG: hypothetical protein ACRCYQ_14755 [Nocardioides sp.]
MFADTYLLDPVAVHRLSGRWAAQSHDLRSAVSLLATGASGGLDAAARATVAPILAEWRDHLALLADAAMVVGDELAAAARDGVGVDERVGRDLGSVRR